MCQNYSAKPSGPTTLFLVGHVIVSLPEPVKNSQIILFFQFNSQRKYTFLHAGVSLEQGSNPKMSPVSLFIFTLNACQGGVSSLNYFCETIQKLLDMVSLNYWRNSQELQTANSTFLVLICNLHQLPPLNLQWWLGSLEVYHKMI